MRHRPVAATVDGDLVGSVTLAGPDGDVVVLARFVLDATPYATFWNRSAVPQIIDAGTFNRGSRCAISSVSRTSSDRTCAAKAAPPPAT